MRKQVTASILSAVVAASAVMAGCGSDSAATTAAATKAEKTEAATKAEETKAEEKTDDADASETDGAKEESGEDSGKRYPTDIGLEKIGNGETFTIAIQPDSHIESYDNNWLTNYLEEQLGVNIEFYMMPSNSADF